MAALTFLRTRPAHACTLAGVVLRLAILVWGYARFEPVADGIYYHAHAVRLAEGLGYSWPNEDGTARFVAHYPVGYPAFIAAFHRLIGPEVGAAMIANALVGSVATVLFVRMCFELAEDRRRATLAALSFALHPALLLYTPAVMTEAFTASLYAILFACFVGWLRATCVSVRTGWLLAFGLTAGLATLVRPQSLLLVLAFTCGAMLVRERLARRGVAALSMIALTLAVVLPWTARNCEVMQECSFVSMNDGWNLLIGTNPAAQGSWAEVVVPDACAGLDGEAAINRCFGDEARRAITRDPLGWLSLAPAKLSRTFDYAGAGPWYLHASNPLAFPYTAKVATGALETAWMRVVLGCALAGLLRRALPSRRRVATLVAVMLAILPWATPAHLLFAFLAFGAMRREKPTTVLLALAGALVVLTAVVHVIFFGSGRYALMLVPSASLGLLLGGGSDSSSGSPPAARFEGDGEPAATA